MILAFRVRRGNSDRSILPHGKGKSLGLNVVGRDAVTRFADGVGLADIEQALVYGAQAARGVTVILTD